MHTASLHVNDSHNLVNMSIIKSHGIPRNSRQFTGISSQLIVSAARVNHCSLYGNRILPVPRRCVGYLGLREFTSFSYQFQVRFARASHFWDSETCEFPSLPWVPVEH